MNSLNRTDWHQLSSQQAARLLGSDPTIGLSLAAVEARQRQRQFGPNQMAAQKRLSEWMRLLLQFHQPLIYVLLVATAVTGALGEWVSCRQRADTSATEAASQHRPTISRHSIRKPSVPHAVIGRCPWFSSWTIGTRQQPHIPIRGAGKFIRVEGLFLAVVDVHIQGPS